MTYRITHRTDYKYKTPVSFGNHAAYLTPRSLPHHMCTSHELVITPAPASVSRRSDYFGNSVDFFTIDEPHTELSIESRSTVEIDDHRDPERVAAWRNARRRDPADSRPTDQAGL